jgi:energy-coupling factor transporter ATP-binding protein EcfA2
MADAPILSLRGINKGFGAVHVLKNVDFEARTGEVTSLGGDNGAGKSTLVKIIGGSHSLDSGTYEFDGRPAVGAPSPACRGVGHRDRLPGPRAGRQPRRGPEHVPRTGNGRSASCSTRHRWRSPRGRCSTASRCARSPRCGNGSRACLSGSGRGGDRQGSAVERQAGHSRRADGRLGRGATARSKASASGGFGG